MGIMAHSPIGAVRWVCWTGVVPAVRMGPSISSVMFGSATFGGRDIRRRMYQVPGIQRRDAVGGPQMAIDGEGLAADLGRDPAGENGDQSGGRHEDGGAVQHRPVIEPPLPARDQRPGAEAQHGEADGDHDAEGEEDDADGGLILQRDRV
jgi:hypothetical protein